VAFAPWKNATAGREPARFLADLAGFSISPCTVIIRSASSSTTTTMKGSVPSL
jgi:hypothetical protein